MLWVLKKTVLLSTQNIYAKTDGYENIHNFTLKIFAYLNLCKSNNLSDQTGNINKQ